jgi:hypothetical protein
MTEAQLIEPWTMKGSLLGACNCDWGCPCNFDAPPTYGHCEGMYTWVVREGRYGDVSLDGVVFGWGGRSPGPLHEGHGTAVVVIDEAASPEQREAIETLTHSAEAGLPFGIFASITETWLETLVTPIEVDLNGIDSKVKMGGGDIFELELSRIPNPVTGEKEELYLDKPTGFTATRAELGSSVVDRFGYESLSWDSADKYAEYSEFEYAGP